MRLGKISSRDEAMKSIEAICEYYRRFEPSEPRSPPSATGRTLLTKMDFLEIVEELGSSKAANKPGAC